MDYQTLDNIADAYIPLLLLIVILAIAIRSLKDRSTLAVNLKELGNLLIMSAVAYGIMFVDQWLGLWANFGQDYSTHTAIAVVLAYRLGRLFPARRYFIDLSLVGYAGLMIYQGYHSLGDIVSTGMVIFTSIYLLDKLLIVLCKPKQ